MKAFHLLLIDGSFIFLECILIFDLILLMMIDSTSDKKRYTLITEKREKLGV